MAPGLSVATLLLGAVPSLGFDAASLLQDAPYIVHHTQAPGENIDYLQDGSAVFRRRMLRFIFDRDAPITQKCCDLALNNHIRPYKSWGSISAEDKAWWKENHCTSMVGALAINTSSTLPNCLRPGRIRNVVRHADPLELVSLYRSSTLDDSGDPEEPDCTEEERRSINNTVTGKGKYKERPVACNVNMYQLDSMGTLDRECLSNTFGISEDCAGCTATFMKEFARDVFQMMSSDYKITLQQKTCFSECYWLKSCLTPDSCPESLKWCQDCIEPRMAKYHHCLGGPIINQLTMPDFFDNIVGVNWFSRR
mmetsp:Transcript_62403/g.140664  ORF Transcript_62403/g.140664 Transcript_62403/m.140664 type:complete len:309 (+) Transcript_62403:55-981(+)